MPLEKSIETLRQGITQAKDFSIIYNRHEFIFRQGLCELMSCRLYRALTSLVITQRFPIKVLSCKCEYFGTVVDAHGQYFRLLELLPDVFRIQDLPKWQQEYLAERVKLAETLLEFLIKTNNFLKLNTPQIN